MAIRWMGYVEEVLADGLYGWRMLLKNPVVSLIAVGSLAMGMGANTAIFSIIDAILLKSLPVERPQELFSLGRVLPQGEGESFSYPMFERMQSSGVLGPMFAFGSHRLRTSGSGNEITAELVSDDYFNVLRIQPLIGRLPARSRFRETGASPSMEAAISQTLWESQFGGESSAIGRSLTLNGKPFTIVGVVARPFTGVSLDFSTDVWLPISMQPVLDGQSLMADANMNWVRVVTRMPSAALDPTVANRANKIFQRALQENGPAGEPQRLVLVPAGRPVTSFRKVATLPLIILMGIALLVLAIACVNIANLVLARSASRDREFTIRASIGAGRERLIRQLLTENLLVAVLGGVLGIAIAFAANGLLTYLIFNGRLVAGPPPSALTFHPDPRVLVFTAGMVIVVGIFFGLIPALRCSSVELVSALKQSSGESHRGMGPGRVRLLLPGQIAFSLLLLIIAGLFVRSFQKIASVRLGFDPQGVVQVSYDLTQAAYSNGQLRQRWTDMYQELKSLPGVSSGAMAVPGVFNGSGFQTSISAVAGATRTNPEPISVTAVTPGFFATLHTPLLRGRDVSDHDTEKSAPVALLNETAARALFGTTDVVGRYIRLYGDPGGVEVAGVVGDAKLKNPLEPPTRIVYTPLTQAKGPVLRYRMFQLRTAGNAPALLGYVRAYLRRSDRHEPVEARLLEDLVEQSLSMQHLAAWLSGLFGLLGLALACIGVYGIVSYSVSQRTREIGIRIALGAEVTNLRWMIWKEAMHPVAIGVFAGLGAALVATRLVGSLLFGLVSTDPLTLLAAALFLSGAAGLAAFLPAWRAARIEPLTALRYE